MGVQVIVFGNLSIDTGNTSDGNLTLCFPALVTLNGQIAWQIGIITILLFDVLDKARLDLAVLKGSPVEVVEPWVVLDLLATVDAQPLRSLPHQALVDEVSCLTRVAHWDLVLLHRCLLL